MSRWEGVVEVMEKTNANTVVDDDSTSSQPMLNTEELLGLPIDDVIKYMKTSQDCLTIREAVRRLEIFGHNELAKRKKRNAIEKFLLQLRSPLVIILLFAGFISGLVGEIINAVIIFSMVMLSLTLLFYQESKAEKAAEILKEKVTTTTTVVRDGKRQEIKLSEIVPGDIVSLSAGDIVPADARVI